MSAVYFSALDGLITIHLFVDEAEDFKTEIERENASENMKEIVRRLGASIKKGKEYIEKHS